MGDFMSVDSLSRFSPANWKQADSKLNEEIEMAKTLLSKIDKRLKKVKDKYYLEGNHEDRITRWVCERAARLGNLKALGVPSLLELDKRGWRFIPLDEQPLILGKANFVHGYYVNQYHANKTVQETGRNVFYAHAHDHQVMYAKHMPGDKPHKAASFGCLCDLNQSYLLKNKPTRWVHGIGLIEFFDSGMFSDYFLPIINYTCAYNGRVFRG